MLGTVEINHGNAYNADTGDFIAPLGGIYVFHLFYTAGGRYTRNTQLQIHVNWRPVCTGHADLENDQGVCSAIVRLERGHKVTVMSASSEAGVSGNHFTGFSGFRYSR